MDAAIRQRVVMEILGHSQISITSRYAHVLPQVMTDAADRIGQALWGLPRSGRESGRDDVKFRYPGDTAGPRLQ
jgi:integrase